MGTNEVFANNVRQRIDAGELPLERPKVWAGFGNGEACSVCDQTIYRAQLMYEIGWAEKTYRVHTACYGVWTGELVRRALVDGVEP